MNLKFGFCSFLVALVALTPQVSFASSDDAWAKFQTDVAAACRIAMELEPAEPILVEPFGSERFGYAVHESDTGPMVCVYEKSTGKTEIGREFVETK